MLEFTRNLINELCRELEENVHAGFGKSITARQSIARIVSVLSQIKSKLKEERFENEYEEIEFFRYHLPKILSLLIYYLDREKLESLLCFRVEKQLEQATNALMTLMDQFFKENFEFMRYWRSGSTERDHLYFLQGENAPEQVYDLLAALIDPAIYRPYSARIAYFLAYERLTMYIQNGYREKPENLDDYLESAPPIKWTSTGAAFCELIYGLDAMGVFNHGAASKQEITAHLSKCFSVKLENPSSTFQRLIYRNKGETSFFDQCSSKVKEFIERLREKSIQKNLRR